MDDLLSVPDNFGTFSLILSPPPPGPLSLVPACLYAHLLVLLAAWLAGWLLFCVLLNWKKS